MTAVRLRLALALLFWSAVGQAQTLYVASLNTNQILAYNGSTGASLGVFASGGGLSGPARLTFGPDGNLYVTGFYSNQVLKYDGTTGAFISAFVSAGSGGLRGPVGLTFGPDGNLYVSSSGTSEVRKYDGVTGAFISAFVSAGSGGLVGPESLTFGPDGNLYVGSGGDASYVNANSVLEYDGGTGAFIRVFVSKGSGGLDGPAGLLFRNNNLYVSSQSTNQVLIYNGSTGAFISAFMSAGSGGLNITGDLVFGPDGNMYVNSYATNEVLKYDGSTGAFTSAFVSAGSGGLSGSQGLTFSRPQAHLYSVCLLYDPTKAVRSGATIPIKLQLCNGSGSDLSSSSIVLTAISVTQISTSISGAVENTGNSNPDSNFRFDATLGSTGGYIFNLKTIGFSTGTYNVNFTVTGDSFVYAAPFQVK